MFNFLKKDTRPIAPKKEVIVAEKPNVIEKFFAPKQTTQQIIEEIHETFYTEVDRLLAEAKVANSLDTDKQDILDKANRLRKLGFSATKETAEASIEENRLKNLTNENEQKARLIEAINHFQFQYPNYKFITEASVKKICQKYSLVYGDIAKYIGTVPDINLKQIEEFKIKPNDECWLMIHNSFRPAWDERRTQEIDFISKSNAERQQVEEEVQIRMEFEKHQSIMEPEEFEEMVQQRIKCNFLMKPYNLTQAPLEIAAPLSDFNMNRSEVKNFKVSDIPAPDPVVLQPVFFKGMKHYLIISAWGLEASDELVINEKLN